MLSGLSNHSIEQANKWAPEHDLEKHLRQNGYGVGGSFLQKNLTGKFASLYSISVDLPNLLQTAYFVLGGKGSKGRHGRGRKWI